MSTLHAFVSRGDLDAVVKCLDRHEQTYMDVRDSTGSTALHLAVERGELAIGRLLIQRDCRLDMVDAQGDTAVHLAVRHERVALLKHMLARGPVDVDARNHAGASAIDLASVLSSGKCHRMLCKHIGTRGTTANQLSTELTTSQHLAKQRRRKIRERLAKAAHTSARDWQMLFSDCSDVNGNVVDRPSSASHTTSSRRRDNGGTSTSTEKAVPCACAPMLYRMQEEQGKAHTSLLDELDACHHELTAEIKQLRHMTELRLATLQQRLEAERRAKGEWGDCRASDESDVEVKGRPMTTDSGDSDDVHAVINAPYASSRRRHDGGRAPKPRNNMIAWSMNEFNRQLLLDDSCTTPTTVSTHSGGHSLARRSAATTTTTTSSVASEPDELVARSLEPRRQRQSIVHYHKPPFEATRDELALVMAPSVDSGYDMGGTMASQTTASRSPESAYAELLIPPPPCKPLPPTPGQRTHPPRATRRLHS